jgi:23S rRNA pseudouridine1911/1915/1917 synthase
MRTVELTITDENQGGRIDRVLGKLFFPEYSRSYLTCMIEAGTIRVNGSKVKKNYRLARGEMITLDFSDRVDETPEAEDIPLQILFEDEHLIVIDKPEGMVIHPGKGTRTGTLVNALRCH